MHRLLRKYLPDATGISEFVIALNIDIRGFSAFSQEVESPAVAAYIKRVYVELIDHYYPDATFFKPTGDGLLLTVEYNESNLQTKVRNVVASSFRVLTDFGSFTLKDPMVNFEVPRRVGIGISRGTVCRLVSKGKTLDCSGRVLNLASRLNDIARPSGIVFDADFGLGLLTKKQVAAFDPEQVYIKGIAERDPLEIYFSKEFTTISPFSKQAIDQTKWGKLHYDITLRRIRTTTRFRLELKSKPVDPSKIRLKVTHPSVRKGRKQIGMQTFFDFTDIQYVLDADAPGVSIRFDALAKRLTESGVKENWPIEFDITYPEV